MCPGAPGGSIHVTRVWMPVTRNSSGPCWITNARPLLAVALRKPKGDQRAPASKVENLFRLAFFFHSGLETALEVCACDDAIDGAQQGVILRVGRRQISRL